ncbi:hypothetical protein LAZ67_X004830 [Cordylochernes scorpioides]|uniref:Reverse transcriptase domain-containing protein n=1 Tax=Cordylochernes scorpioides TaxID=51811 RepID=A0ABY6LV93_9ARAC|nr:hypothetical protein LAZ67_X004830 [Cordylochernes scorpioides]
MLESAAKASASMLGTASNYRQSQTFTKVCLDHGAMINESCTPIPHSMRSDVEMHAASPVAQNKQGHVQDLGRGFCPISIIQSPQTSHFAASKQLSILQCNINGLCSTATKIKLEEIMEIAEKQKIQIIALQETKLNEKYNLKYKNYNILRKDRNKEGGGLAFLIKNLYYEDIAINIPNTSDLEAQEISTKTKTSSIKEKFWNFKKANWNLYQQNTNEDFRKAPTRIKDLEQNWISFKNTIIKAAKVSIPRDYALENTDLNKTPGPDGIHGQMISNLGKNGKEKLLDIFNNSWKTGKLPQDWKTATIIPIKKLDKSADDPKNYRPISLTSICCKLMEKIILRRLTYHLDTRNLLPKEQYGFRKGHGTIDQLLFFTQKVKDAQNRKPTNHTIAAFLDLTQAFDKVWKNKLITKLYKHFKIDGKAITWINDFLKNRYIRVKYNGTLSKTFKLYQGLPQGSVLSPTLFTLFIAGIEEKISHKTNIGLFADDIILWSSNTNWKKAERDLNKTLFHLEKFANKHKLEFNPQKSETCLFTTDKKLYKIRPKIILKEQHLQYNKHPKYLGYTLDPEINSSKHIEEVIRKGRDRLKILKYISGREWGADATTLKLTYTSLIRPILEYGYQIYGTASETNLKSLERIQLSAARIITGLRNTCPNDIVLYEADIMPLKDRRSYNLPKYINKIKSYGNKHRTSKYILNWESNLRLKKEGLLHLAKRNEFLKYKVEKNYLAEKNSPCKPLQNVIFNATLNEPTNKQYQNPEYLKQLSLEIINNIPKNAITIYTDGSRDELGHTGSGCLIKTTNGIEKMNRRNPDFCSVFRSELIAIYEALKSIKNTNYQDIWILTDSRSAIQHLSHTGELRDKISRNIIGYLQKPQKFTFNGYPHTLALKKNKLPFKEIETIAKTKINKNWRIPPKHSWYSGVNPGGALNIRNRQHQTTLTRFRTGHLKPLKIENNNKIYPTCPKCSLAPAAPEHILACIRCTKQDLWERPLLIIKQLEEHELMEFGNPTPGLEPHGHLQGDGMLQELTTDQEVCVRGYIKPGVIVGKCGQGHRSEEGDLSLWLGAVKAEGGLRLHLYTSKSLEVCSFGGQRWDMGTTVVMPVADIRDFCLITLRHLLVERLLAVELLSAKMFSSLNPTATSNDSTSLVQCWARGPFQEGHDVRGLAGPVVGGVGAVAGHSKFSGPNPNRMKINL